MKLPRQRELTLYPLVLLPIELEQGVGVAVFFVLDVSMEQLQPLARAGRQGSGQVIQIEPADAQAFLVAYERLGIAAGLQGAQERMIMYMVLSPLA